MSEIFEWAKQFAEANSIQALADLTKGRYTRTTMSLYLRDKYPAGAAAIEATLRPLMTRRACPFLAKEITSDDCQSRQSRPKPLQRNGSMFAHWEACQRCSHKEQS